MFVPLTLKKIYVKSTFSFHLALAYFIDLKTKVKRNHKGAMRGCATLSFGIVWRKISDIWLHQ